MNTEALFFSTLLIVAVLAAVSIFVFKRFSDDQHSAKEESDIHGLVEPYGELRRKLAAETPVGVNRPELAMTPSDIVDLVEGLDSEVNNGGLDQFFFNSTGDYALETIEALKQIGAHRTAEIVQRSCDLFPESSPPTDAGSRRILMLESVSPDADAFDNFDELFYESEEELLDLLKKYKNQHSL